MPVENCSGSVPFQHIISASHSLELLDPLQTPMNHSLNPLTRRRWLAATALGAIAFASTMSTPVTSLAAEDSRVFELRVYVTNPGKLPNLLTRFREHTTALFEKHGIENIGYWVPVEESEGANNTLIYIIAHKSREAATASWDAFRKDPDWIAAAKASEADGKILAKKPEATFLKATDYSAAIKPSKGDGERVFELRTYTTAPGKLDALNSRFREHTVKLFSKHGMTHIGYWTPTEKEPGAENTLIYILSHQSKDAGLKSFGAFREDPNWIAAKAASEKDGSLTIPQPDGVKSVYMKAVDFSPIK